MSTPAVHSLTLRAPFASRARIANEGGAGEEKVLLARCKAGEREALDEFLQRYRTRVLNLAFQLLRDQSAAEDIAQEVFVRAFSHLDSFRGEAQIFTWLYQITLNECRKKTRRSKNHVLIDDLDVGASTRSEDVEHKTLQKIALEAALDSLSQPLHIVLILRELHGLSYEEIAQVLKLPPGTVRSRLHAARREFRRVWDEG